MNFEHPQLEKTVVSKEPGAKRADTLSERWRGKVAEGELEEVIKKTLIEEAVLRRRLDTRSKVRAFNKFTQRLNQAALIGGALILNADNGLELSFTRGQMDVGTLAHERSGENEPTYEAKVRELEADYFGHEKTYGVPHFALYQGGSESWLSQRLSPGMQRAESRQNTREMYAADVQQFAESLRLDADKLLKVMAVLPVESREFVKRLRYDPTNQKIHYKGAEHLTTLAYHSITKDGRDDEIVFTSKELVDESNLDVLDAALRDGLLHEGMHGVSPMYDGHMNMAQRINEAYARRQLVKDEQRPKWGYSEAIEAPEDKDEEFATLLLTDAAGYRPMNADSWSEWVNEYAAVQHEAYGASIEAAQKNAEFVKTVFIRLKIKPWEFSKQWHTAIDNLLHPLYQQKLEKAIEQVAEPGLKTELLKVAQLNVSAMPKGLKDHQQALSKPHELHFLAPKSIEGYLKLERQAMQTLGSAQSLIALRDAMNTYLNILGNRYEAEYDLPFDANFVKYMERTLDITDQTWQSLLPRERGQVLKEVRKLIAYVETSPLPNKAASSRRTARR